MSPIDNIKSDLLEAQILYANPHSQLLVNLSGRPKPKPIQRVFLTGANPFVLTTEKLLQIAELIHKYFPSVDSISCFARITDSANKTNKELVHLRQAGYNDLTIGAQPDIVD